MILTIPMKLPSCANLREHWATRAKRVKAQRTAVWAAFRSRAIYGALSGVTAMLMRGEQLEARLIRQSPRRLDDDNAVSSLKAARDQVAKELGINDGGDSVVWTYSQRKGPALLVIEIRPLESSSIAAAVPPDEKRLKGGGIGLGINQEAP